MEILQGAGVDRMKSIDPKLPIMRTPRIMVESVTVVMMLLEWPLGAGILPRIGASSGSDDPGFSLYLTMKYVIRPNTITATAIAR